jgi:hypothetical protein
MSIITLNPAKGFEIRFPTSKSQYTISTTYSPDSSDPSVPIIITVSFDRKVPFNFILVNNRRIICDPKDNKVFIYEVEQCHILSNQIGCTRCDCMYDENHRCSCTYDESIEFDRLKTLQMELKKIFLEEWKVPEEGCSAQSESVEYCETCCCFHDCQDGCPEY